MFCTQSLIYDKTLDSIVNKIRSTTKSLVGHKNKTMENVQDLNEMNFFKKQHNPNQTRVFQRLLTDT